MKIDNIHFFRPCKILKSLQSLSLGLFCLLLLVNCGGEKEANQKEAPKENKQEVKEKTQTTQAEIVSLDSLLEENIAKSSGQLQEKLNTWKDILQYLKDDINSDNFKQKSKEDQKATLQEIQMKKDSIEALVKEVFP